MGVKNLKDIKLKRTEMKKAIVLKYLLPVFVVSILAGCEDFLDVQPQQEIGTEFVFKTPTDVESALYGAYERIAGPQLFAGTSVFFSDLIASDGSDVRWTGTFIGYRQMEEKAMDPNDATIRDKWVRAYQAINTVNNVLANLHIAREADRARIEGEARFIRGIMHFELVRFFASPYVAGNENLHHGVPLKYIPTIVWEDAAKVFRAPVAVVYDSIISDLTAAKRLLSDLPAHAGANGGRASSSVVAAFLARVYMATDRWEAAAIEANYVIRNFGGYTALNIVPRNAFNNIEYTREDVFMILQDKASHAGNANAGIATFFASLSGMGRGDMDIQETHFDRYEPGDLRDSVTINPQIVLVEDVPDMFYEGVGTKAGFIRTSKWGKYDANVQVIRLAEMILTRAEANFRNGSAIGAEPIDDLNAIRRRAQASEWDPLLLTIDMIAEERFRELCFEGHALHDMRRFRGSVTPYRGPYAEEELQWNDPRLVLPIPQREIDANENLVQNEAYD